MRSKFTYLLCLAFLMLAPVISFSQDWVRKMQDPNTNFFETRDAFNEYHRNYVTSYRQMHGTAPAKIPGYKIYKRWEWMMAPRVGANGERFNPAKAWHESQAYRQQM